MDIIITNDSSLTTVQIKGELDTTNAEIAQQKLQSVFDNTAGNVVIDGSELTYISSSGLRVFLLLQKAIKTSGWSLTLKNLTPEIRSVFDMTGFSAIFTIV
jgi:anti-sigma B factor antagonist/stage II sporulation protein AA (anti-sigma F factor antagonist)